MPSWRFRALIQGLSGDALWVRITAGPTKPPPLEGETAEKYFATIV